MKLAAIVGPTAVGKSETAVKVAERLGGEILSCDSMQVYRGMDIGTAKASTEQRTRVAHHMIDIVDPDTPYTVADYQRAAKKVIQDLNNRGKLPILVGGTGLYYQAVVDDYEFSPLLADRDIRQQLEKEADESLDRLYNELEIVDPASTSIIKPNDRKRIIRALEVYRLTGRPFSQFQTRNQGLYQLAVVGLSAARTELYRRIEARVDAMIESGFVEEVKTLYAKGYDLPLNSMQALGYKQILQYLKGGMSLEQAVAEIKKETRRYAKRQLTWFRKDKRIFWLDITEYKEAEGLVRKICEYIGRTLAIAVE